MERRNSISSALRRSLRNGDFAEEDVWDVLKDSTSSISEFKIPDTITESPGAVAGPQFPSAARMIPRVTHGGDDGGGYNSINTHDTQQSAPVPIPQWFKSRGKNHRKASKHEDGDGDGFDNGDSDDDNEDDDEVLNNRVPPHEVIARRLAKSQISSFSVFEGVGRTLKGRDLSKVRNAVLNKTGFLESL